MSTQSLNCKLILASSSKYRKSLLERLGLDFSTLSPEIDERPVPGETPQRLVARLAADKAIAVAKRFPTALVIGSDQVAVCSGAIVGKPGSIEKAIEQLTGFSGRTVHFHTAVSLRCLDSDYKYQCMVRTDVVFRDLSAGEISRYVETDLPLDCAGSFKSECAGISLLRSMTSDDPTAIVGLPLIRVAQGLRNAGFSVP